MSTFSYTCRTVCCCDCLERYFNCDISVEPSLVDKMVQPLLVEDRLYFAEHCFDRIVFWAVSDIIYRRDVELLIQRLYFFGFVHGKLIHKQCERPLMPGF